MDFITAIVFLDKIEASDLHRVPPNKSESTEGKGGTANLQKKYVMRDISQITGGTNQKDMHDENKMLAKTRKVVIKNRHSGSTGQ